MQTEEIYALDRIYSVLESCSLLSKVGGDVSVRRFWCWNPTFHVTSTFNFSATCSKNFLDIGTLKLVEFFFYFC